MLWGMFAATCALLAFAAVAQRADAAPKPVAPPQVHRKALHPVPYPGASATKSSLSTSSSSTNVSTVRLTVVSTPVVGAGPGPVAATTPQRPAPRSKRPVPHRQAHSQA